MLKFDLLLSASALEAFIFCDVMDRHRCVRALPLYIQEELQGFRNRTAQPSHRMASLPFFGNKISTVLHDSRRWCILKLCAKSGMLKETGKGPVEDFILVREHAAHA
jgi:hypothetical protein